MNLPEDKTAINSVRWVIFSAFGKHGTFSGISMHLNLVCGDAQRCFRENIGFTSMTYPTLS